MKKETKEKLKTLKEQEENIKNVALEVSKMFESYGLSYLEIALVLEKVKNLAKNFSYLKLPER